MMVRNIAQMCSYQIVTTCYFHIKRWYKQENLVLANRTYHVILTICCNNVNKHKTL